MAFCRTNDSGIRRKRSPAAAVFLLLLLLGCLLPREAGAAEEIAVRKRILYIASADSSALWTEEVLDGFLDGVRRGSARPEIDVAELGILRNPEFAVRRQDSEYLLKAMRRRKYDVVVTEGYAATELVMSRHAEIPRQTQIVFCGYMNFDRTKRVQYPNMTGVELPGGLMDNVRFGLSLLPRTQKIAVVTAGSPRGEALYREFAEEAKSFDGPGIVFLHGSFMGTEEMLRQLRQLPEEAFVVLAGWRSALPEPSVPEKLMREKIVAAAGRPVFTLFDTGLGGGVAGGILLRGGAHGREAAALASRILGGERAGELPVLRSGARPVMDWNALPRLELPPGQLPPETAFVNRPGPGWKAWYQEGAAGIAVVLIALTAYLFFTAQRDRSRKKMNALFAALPIHVGVVDGRGRILFYQAGNPVFSTRRPKRLPELPLELLREIERPLAEVFRTGAPARLEYGVFGTYLQLELLSLPRQIFRREAVMWISADVTQLHKAYTGMTRLADNFRLILDSIGDAVIVTDCDGVIVRMNPMARKLTGWEENTAVGRKVDDVFAVVPAAGEKGEETIVRAVLDRGEEVRFDNHTELLSRDGKRYHVTASASPIREADGEISGAVLFFRDVTDDFEKRATLDAQNAILRNATEVARIVYFRCDETGRMTPLGDFGRHWGCRDGGPVPAEEWLEPADLDGYRRELTRLFSGAADAVNCFYRAGGETPKRSYEMRLVKSPQPGENGARVFYGIIQDITELVRQREQLREAMESAQAANRDKSRFIAGVSHELRAPLDAVIGFSELLQMDGIPREEVLRDLQAVNLAGRTLLAMVNNVFDFTEIETDKLEIQPSPMNLRELLSEIFMIFRQTAEGRNLKLELILPEHMPRVVLDPQRLRQVLLNLVGRAVRSVRDGSVVISAKFVMAEAASGHGELAVRIIAAGNAVECALVTGRFGGAGEAGLEYKLSQRLCSRMGGSLECTGGSGGGGSFTVVFRELPCVPSAPAETVEPAAPGGERNDRVLLVDDVPMNLKVMSAMFNRLEIPHTCCASAREAIGEVGRAIPAAVFTDLWMPEMGGDELAGFLARNPATASVPVIVVTSDLEIGRNVRSHFREVLLKPLTLEALQECLKHIRSVESPERPEGAQV